MKAPPNREVVIFNAAVELPTGQRNAYLQEACGDDPALRQQIESLLRVHEEAGAFMESLTLGGEALPAGSELAGGSIRAAFPPSEQAGDHIGRYKLLQQIGEGGCGVVYMAEQEEPVRRRVALKIIKLGMDSRQVIARFEAERQALALMDHSNIAKVFDAGSTETGRPYFVMELIKGIPITHYCDLHNLSTVARLCLFVQVCHAIQHAHQKGIIHRDIKPSNVLVADHDGVPIPKVIDFGIAKATNGQLLTDKTQVTDFDQFVGTVAYMAPEQAKPSWFDIDTRSDIYSLGVLLYELLTGKTPFEVDRLQEAGLDEARRIIREEQPLRPSARLNKLDASEQTAVAGRRQSDPRKLEHLLHGDLDWIVLKALEKDRSRRYATVNALMLDLQRQLDNEPVMARPPSKLYRFRKLVARNKLIFTAAGGMSAALLLGTAVSVWQAVRAKHAEDRAIKSSTRLEQKTEALRLLEYVNAMNLALRYSRETNFSGALRLIQEQRPAAGEPDLRGFEWRYLYRLCRGNYESTLPKHKQVVGSMEFSADRRFLATFCWDGMLRLWNLETNAAAPMLEVAKATGLGGFSVQGDELVFGDNDQAIQCYDIPSQRVVKTIPKAGRLVAWAPRPKVAATFLENSGIQVWDVATGRVRFSTPSVQRQYLSFGSIDRVALDPEGRFLASVEPRLGLAGAERDQGIHLWDLTTGQDLGLLKDERQIRSLRFSPSGEQLAVGDGAGAVIIWEMATRQSRLIQAHQKPVTALVFLSDGSELITGSSDETVKCWDLSNLKEKPTHWRGNAGQVTALGLSRDGQWLAGGGRDSTIKIWRKDPDEVADEIRGLHTKDYGNFAFSSDARSIAAGFEDRTVKILDARTLTTNTVLKGMLYVVGFTRDSKHLLTANPDKVGYWWDLDNKTSLRLPGYVGDIGAVFCVDLSPDGHLTALGLGDGTIEVVDFESGKAIARFTAHSGPVKTVRFSSNGSMLVSGGMDQKVKLWDVRTGNLLRESVDLHKGAVCAAAISRDSTLVATGCGVGTVKLWNSANFTNPLATIVCHASAMRTLAFSNIGSTLASGGEDHVVKLWSVASLRTESSQREVASFLRDDKVRVVEFSPDDNSLAVVTDNSVLHLFRAVSLADADEEIIPSTGDRAR